MNKYFEINTKDINFVHTVNEIAPKSLEISHCHDNYEFLFIVDGNGKYIIEGTEFSVAPGMLMCARPLEYHCIKINSGAQYERYVINFNPTAVSPEVRDVFSSVIAGEKNSSTHSAFTFSESIVSVFDRFVIANSMSDERRDAFMKLLLSEIIMLVSVSAGETRTLDDGELGARVIKYLNENICKNISLDKIAKRFFVSKYYLCRAFKSYNGISVHGYITKKRVMLAKQLIESGETASSAAYRVGFGDYSAFYRAYVKVLGEAPTLSARTLQNTIEEVQDGI